MHNLNPNEMDALFREGAENHEFKYNEDAWNLMEEKLDQGKRRRIVIWFFTGLLLLAAIFGLYQYNTGAGEPQSSSTITSTNFEDGSNKSIKSESDITTMSDLIEEAVETNGNIILESEITESISLASDINNNTKEEYINEDSKVSISNIGAQQNFHDENTGSLVHNEVVSIVQSEEIDFTQKGEENTQVIVENPQSEKTSVIQTSHGQIGKQTKNLINVALIDSKNSKISEFDREVVSPQVSNYIPPIFLAEQKSRFAGSIFASPEWSSVGLFKESKAGWSVGTKVGYQFFDKFELSAGVAYSRKIYKGAGEEYNMLGGWYDIAPQRMDAKCDVLEIPLSLTYYKNGYAQNGFFADLGISSYMLHSEWYGFEYDDALIRPDEYLEVVEEDSNSHLVGVGRFSIGYQKILSNQSAIQVAPYIQFPLTGIGAGKVNLYSSGVQIALKFNTK